MTITKRYSLLGRGILKITLSLLMIGSTVATTLAQTGYIYVQKKALDETVSDNFSFTVTGGPTPVASFTLNDGANQISLRDIGASQNGRLWAVGTNNILYYRALGSSNWVATSVTNAARVDGGAGGTAYIITTLGTVVYYDGAITTTILTSTSAVDIGSAWDNRPYVISNGRIYQYSGTGAGPTGGASWVAVGSSSDNIRIDGNPESGNAISAKSDNSVWDISGSGSATSLGRPAGISSTPTALAEVAVTSDGTIFGTFKVATLSNNFYAFRWTSGTNWSAPELTSREYTNAGMTGGLGQQVWGIYTGGNTVSANLNIFTRTLNGGTELWLNDERVQTTAPGNSVMIAVTPGTYAITEQVAATWHLQQINVYDPSSNSSQSLPARTATINVADGETVTAVFENWKVAEESMTTSCVDAYLEDFGTGIAGTYGLPLAGQTSYHYQTTGNTLANNYKIAGNANMLFAGAKSLTDHTTKDGHGRMFLVDANNEKDAFFRRRFTGIISGASYNFSAWIANINAGAPIKPDVTFEVIDPATDAVLESISTGAITSDAVWTKFGLTFTAPAGSSTFDLVIKNNGLGGEGNDLAIDDISFSLSPPTPTVVLQNSDCAGGLGSITITAPIGAYEYSIDGINWQASPAFANVTAGTYTASVRFTGTTNCTNSSTQATVLAAICGNVFHDANGLTDINVNGTGIGQASATQLYVSLYNGTTLVGTVPVNADGTYSFIDVPPNTTYTAVPGTNPAGNATSVFQGSGSNGWVATGEDCCDNVGDDSVIDGTLTIVVGSSNVNNANFGIQQLPDSDPKSTQVFQPFVGQLITLNGGSNPPVLAGSDPEDMPAGGLLTGKTVTITTVPDNSELYYDNVLVTSGLTIPGFDPSKLQVKFTTATLGDTTTKFEYAYVDLSGAADPTPAIYELRWEDPMPVTLVSFDVARAESAVLVSWVTTSETNSSHFDIERSIDARKWEAAGKVAAAESSNKRTTYDFIDHQAPYGTIYYRLKMVDLDESYAYSQIRSLSTGRVKLSLYPNPVAGKLHIDDANAARLNKVIIYSKSGVAVYSKQGANQSEIDLSGFPAGSYVVTLIYNDGSQASRTIIKH